MENANELMYMSRMGDEKALATLLSLCKPIIYKEVQKIIVSYQKLGIYYDDFIQECLIAYYYAIDRYREDRGCKFSTFLNTVVQRRLIALARHYLKSAKVQLHDTVSLDEVLHDKDTIYDYVESKNSLQNPEYLLKINDGYAKANEAIGNLKPIEKQVYELWQKGTSYDSASKALGLSYKSYDGYVQRIKKKIRLAVLSNSY